MKVTSYLRILLTVFFLLSVLTFVDAGQQGLVISPGTGKPTVKKGESAVTPKNTVPKKEEKKAGPVPKKNNQRVISTTPKVTKDQPKATIPAPKPIPVKPNIIVQSFSYTKPQGCKLGEPFKEGEGTTLHISFLNIGNAKSNKDQKYTIACSVKSGGPECPGQSKTGSFGKEIAPNSTYPVLLSVALKKAGEYHVTARVGGKHGFSERGVPPPQKTVILKVVPSPKLDIGKTTPKVTTPHATPPYQKRGGFPGPGDSKMKTKPSDSVGSVPQKKPSLQPIAKCKGLNPTIFGTSGDDFLQGTPGADVIHGLGGNDKINGLGGDDIICGGDGNDELEGASGNDTLLGGNGHDKLWGSDGDDKLYGKAGNDILEGHGGHDYLEGGYGNDHLSGGDGNDELQGIGGSNTLVGGSGNDKLFGGWGSDWLYGNSGDDRLSGQSGNDSLEGGPGNDVLRGGDGDDTLFGCDINDECSGSDKLYGGNGNDTLYGGCGPLGGNGPHGMTTTSNELYGEAGNDKLYANLNSKLNGGPGNDACIQSSTGMGLGLGIAPINCENEPMIKPKIGIENKVIAPFIKSVDVLPYGTYAKFFVTTWADGFVTLRLHKTPVPIGRECDATLAADRVVNSVKVLGGTEKKIVVTNLKPGWSYTWEICSEDLSGGNHRKTGIVKTLRRRATVTVSKVDIIDDSDRVGAGECQFGIFMNPDAGSFGEQNAHYPPSYGTVPCDSGETITFDPDLVVTLLNVRDDTLKFNATGWDQDDADCNNCPIGWIDGSRQFSGGDGGGWTLTFNLEPPAPQKENIYKTFQIQTVGGPNGLDLRFHGFLSVDYIK